MFFIFFIYLNSEGTGPSMEQERTAKGKGGGEMSYFPALTQPCRLQARSEQSPFSVPATPGCATPLQPFPSIKKHAAHPMLSGQEEAAGICGGSATCSLLAESLSILSTVLDRYYYYPHLGDGKTEAPGGSEA